MSMAAWNRVPRFFFFLHCLVINCKRHNDLIVVGHIFNSKTITRQSSSWLGGRLNILRGGANSERGNVTVEDYVAAVEEKDAQHRTSHVNNGDGGDVDYDGVDENSEDVTTTNNNNNGGKDGVGRSTSTNEDNNSSGVGVKSHHSGKKSNAVGDPDGDDDDSDDSDDATTDEEEWQDLDEKIEDLSVQVEVEVVEDHQNIHAPNEDPTGTSSDAEPPAASAGGGVAVRSLGQRLSNRRKTRNNSSKEWGTTSQTSSVIRTKEAGCVDHQHILDQWSRHVYLPPTSSAIDYIVEKARFIDAAAKTRLDRRILYAGLLLEWSERSTTYRKFMDSKISQSLQAALSLASQPQWREAFPRPSAFKLYEEDTDNKSCTLAMQETIAMALAHSLGSAFVILDDEIFFSIREELSRVGLVDEDVQPEILLRYLMDFAKNGQITKCKTDGKISSCMKRDLELGLDDPHDDHAKSSCDDMMTWESRWVNELGTSLPNEKNEKSLPLVLFLRTEASNTLLKSKSFVESIIQESNSKESVNLIIFGKGIDASTVSIPQEPTEETSSSASRINHSHQNNGAAPWFGFSTQNQNASGQNDPEGSRRFNIFLARTVDGDGNPGILGAIAPPQAGNLFPHMMAMQARERLKQHDDDSDMKEELERWTQLLEQQMQTNVGNPLPPPKFFNATLGTSYTKDEDKTKEGQKNSSLSQEDQKSIQKALQRAMTELLDRLAQANDGTSGDSSELSPDLHKAFAQILRKDNLRKDISDNLARAAPALSDPKCQGVMLSVFVPPPPHYMKKKPLGEVRSNLSNVQAGNNASNKSQNNVGGWFQNILNKQDNSSIDEEQDESRRKSMKQKRTRTMAAAAAVMAANEANDDAEEIHEEKRVNEAEKNLSKLESLCTSIAVKIPTDPVRAKSWKAWISRERGAVVFRNNRKILNKELGNRNLSLRQNTGTLGAGSALRQMLSVRDISDEIEAVIKCAVELEASKSQRLRESREEIIESEMDLEIDVTLSQLLVSDDGSEQVISTTKSESINQNENSKSKEANSTGKVNVKYLHPSSIETALSLVCRISPSPSGGLTFSNLQASHRSAEEISAMAQDKHERALVSQVVSPQDIGVTYDMIGGLTNVKELLRQSITYPLKFPHLYSEGIAREAVKGVLLFGPPGTGKTMLAKAVATEGGASFLSVDASSVENKWLGESEKNAKAVFTLARRLAPCVIFIDEVDSLLSSREGTSDDSAHGTLTSVKTTMMSEWDGLNSGTNGSGEAGSDRVVVIGSTNRPFDLDEAVLRRFPRRILVDLPDLETRTEILEVTLAENRLHMDVNLTKIAERLEGYTGSDIKEVCREAVVRISHEQAKLLDQGIALSRKDVTQGSLRRLRPATTDDFEMALSKLKRSVSEKGRELARVWEWNDEYGEIKKKRNYSPHMMDMYL